MNGGRRQRKQQLDKVILLDPQQFRDEQRHNEDKTIRSEN